MGVPLNNWVLSEKRAKREITISIVLKKKLPLFLNESFFKHMFQNFTNIIIRSYHFIRIEYLKGILNFEF